MKKSMKKYLAVVVAMSALLQLTAYAGPGFSASSSKAAAAAANAQYEAAYGAQVTVPITPGPTVPAQDANAHTQMAIQQAAQQAAAQQAAAPSASRSPRGSSFKTKAPLNTTRITPVKAMKNPSSVRREKRSSPAKWARMAVKMGAAATMMLTFAASVWVRAVFSV